MAEGTSVGKISLDIDLTEDISKQVDEMASSIGKALRVSIESSTKNIFDGLEKTIDKSMETVRTIITSQIEKMKEETAKTLEALKKMTRRIKLPKIPQSFSKPTNEKVPSFTARTMVQPRAPPIPKVDTGFNVEAIRAQMDNLTKSLDITNAKIEQQKTKLGELKGAYERAFDPVKKNKIQEEILKVETNINKLISTSDKTGFKLADLDSKLLSVSNTTSTFNESLNNTVNKLEDTAKASTKLEKNTSRLGPVANSIGNKFTSMGKMINSALKRVLIMATLYKVIRGFISYMNSALATNQQFSNSVAQIKTNLQVAFMPIYQAILPALNALARGLAIVTQYIASFISLLFGSTYKASFKAAQGLNTTKAAMAGVGKQVKKTAQEVKKSLAGFDEITNLDLGKDNDPGDTGGGGGIEVPPMVAPPLETGIIESSIKAFIDRLGVLLEPARQALGRLKEAFEPLKENLFAGLKWLLDNVLIPLGVWTISEVLPRFIDMVASGLERLNAWIEILKPLGQWLWDSFLQPLASWTGGVIISVLEKLNELTRAITDWMLENKGTVETMAIVIGSFLLAWKIVNVAKLIGETVGKLKDFISVGKLASGAGGLLKGAIAALTSPIGIAILAIGAIIAIGVLLWKNWDTVKAKASEIWDKIKDIFSRFKDWLKGVFSKEWSKEFGMFGDVVSALFKNIQNIFNGIKKVFEGIIKFITGVFTGNWKKAWEGVKDIFKGIADTFVAIMKAPINGIIGLINSAISGLNKIKIPDWVPLVGGKGINIPKIPMLARGGIIEQPTLAMVGEGGKEAVMPLENNTGWITELANQIVAIMGGASTGDDDGDLILELDGDEFARIAIKAINKRRRKAGLPLLEI